MTIELEPRPLGSTGLKVAPIGLGAAPIGNMMGQVSDEVAGAILEAAAGPDIIFDTAPFYGAGLSERRLGRPNCHGPQLRWRDALVRGQLDAARSESDRHSAHSRPRRSLRRSRARRVPSLRNLKESGAIRAISAGMNQWQMLSRFIDAADFDCFLLAGRFTLLDRSVADFLKQCHARGVGWILGGVFNSGILADPSPGALFDYLPASAEVMARALALERLCRSAGVQLKAAALQFPLRHPAVSAVVVGVSSVAEWRENWALLQQPIPEDLWARLD